MLFNKTNRMERMQIFLYQRQYNSINGYTVGIKIFVLLKSFSSVKLCIQMHVFILARKWEKNSLNFTGNHIKKANTHKPLKHGYDGMCVNRTISSQRSSHFMSNLFITNTVTLVMLIVMLLTCWHANMTSEKKNCKSKFKGGALAHRLLHIFKFHTNLFWVDARDRS